MANTKEQERAELHRTIWKMANEDYNLSVSAFVEIKIQGKNRYKGA